MYEYRIKSINKGYGSKSWYMYQSLEGVEKALKDTTWARSRFGDNPHVERRWVGDWEQYGESSGTPKPKRTCEHCSHGLTNCFCSKSFSYGESSPESQ